MNSVLERYVEKLKEAPNLETEIEAIRLIMIDMRLNERSHLYQILTRFDNMCDIPRERRELDQYDIYRINKLLREEPFDLDY